jgi:AraC-like DNA-binding protein
MTAAIKKVTSGVKGKSGGTAPTVAAGFAKALIELAVSKGADERQLRERAGLRPGDLADQDGRVPLASHIALLKAAAELCHDPAFALHFGEAYSMPELSIVGLIGQSSETVAEAYARAQHFSPLMIDTGDAGSGRFESLPCKDGVWMVVKGDVYLEHPQLAESAFARGMSYFTQMFPGRGYVKAVHFRHSEPSYRAEYERIFRCPIVFDSDRNAFLIDETFLSQELGAPNRYMLGVLSAHAETLLKELESTTTLKGRIESLLIPRLHTGDPGMDEIAKHLGLSRPTLYRKLKAEGLSYEKILDDLRRTLAHRYLENDELSVGDTAYRLGFSDPTAFSRAFKRWTGASPGSRKKRPS